MTPTQTEGRRKECSGSSRCKAREEWFCTARQPCYAGFSGRGHGSHASQQVGNSSFGDSSANLNRGASHKPAKLLIWGHKRGGNDQLLQVLICRDNLTRAASSEIGAANWGPKGPDGRRSLAHDRSSNMNYILQKQVSILLHGAHHPLERNIHVNDTKNCRSRFFHHAARRHSLQRKPNRNKHHLRKNITITVHFRV